MSFDDQLQPVLDVAAEHAVSVDRDGRFPEEAIDSLRDSGLLGLTLPVSIGGLDGSPADFLSVSQALASRCASTAMIYLMHICAAQVTLAATPGADPAALRSMADGTNLSTLAFSERGSRSHFWAPVSRAEEAGPDVVRVSASKSFVTSAGHADGYVVSTLSAAATTPMESTIYYVLSGDLGLTVAGAWRGLGMRGNASAPMVLDGVELGAERALTAPGKGLDMMLGVVLPAFQVGTAAVAVGIAEAAVQATTTHVTNTRLEHMNSSLADLPTLRAQIARMRIETDRARAHLGAVLDSLETPGPATQLMVLEAKAAATEAAVTVTDLAMRTCGGAGFGGAHGIERMFRDARGPIVMAPTSDQAYDFIGRALCGLEVF
jgi:alkylation response protein AidB-like acyl-CoA dehydrogenase